MPLPFHQAIDPASDSTDLSLSMRRTTLNDAPPPRIVRLQVLGLSMDTIRKVLSGAIRDMENEYPVFAEHPIAFSVQPIRQPVSVDADTDNLPRPDFSCFEEAENLRRARAKAQERKRARRGSREWASSDDDNNDGCRRHGRGRGRVAAKGLCPSPPRRKHRKAPYPPPVSPPRRIARSPSPPHVSAFHAYRPRCANVTASPIVSMDADGSVCQTPDNMQPPRYRERTPWPELQDQEFPRVDALVRCSLDMTA